MVLFTSASMKPEACPALPKALTPLCEIARNYWWTWNQDHLTVFREMDPVLWDQCSHNPVRMLEEVSYLRLAALATDVNYLTTVRRMSEIFQDYMRADHTWAKQNMRQYDPQRPIAYFCAEYGLHESLPTYSGGLGMLAADHLKTASDLGIPMVAIGMLYRQGYFQQRLDMSGWQGELYEDFDFTKLPVTRVRHQDGTPMIVEVQMRERTVKIGAWRVDVGRVPLYLLDTDLPENDPIDRWITAHLYGGNKDTRIAQEVVLGIGGVRMLRKLGIAPSVFHLNEGHASFLTLELLREQVEKGSSLLAAEPTVRNQCIFTTHTPVPAGHDAFEPQEMDPFFNSFWPLLGLSREQFMMLGARRSGDSWERFNMTVLAMRYARSTNGVSKLHGHVSREMWQALYPNRSVDEVPISYITNGVHARTWVAPLFWDLYDQYLGKDWVDRISEPEVWSRVDQIPDEELWQRKAALRERLVSFVRHRVLRSRRSRGESHDRIQAVAHLLDPNILTIGFARRFSTYKRGDLILRDLERITRIFSSQARPVQIIFAGKAHPRDDGGKRLIQRILEWSSHPAISNRVAFIENYDAYVGRNMVQGVDVWLNNPRRPLEASGTSGQKVGFSGGLNLSVLDGWWPEGYNGNNGWAVGEAIDGIDSALQDDLDATSIYDLLEQEVISMFYERDEQGIPRRWLARVKEAMRTLNPLFNTERMLKEYVSNMYEPEQLPAEIITPELMSFNPQSQN
ncbi:MAG: glycosyltransferase family 1 protein [Synechococcaceae cyanobacterium SM2_3_1]|nr:glycosyltransferase family 1 protein [Synechococcaceae cyanobacterium SM2_3_1]